MNLLQLKYFCAVCTYHTVSAAAEFLHISQPSVSATIKELEKEFGVLLFKREHRGMMLTHEGEMLFSMSKNILSEVDKAERLMHELGNKKSVLHLGIPPMIGSVMLPEIYKSFSRECPDISLEITEGGRFEILKKLSDGAIDIAFLPHSMALGTNLSSFKVTEFEIVLCVKNDSPLSGLKSVTPEKVRDFPLVLFGDGFFQTEEIRKWFATQKENPKVILKTQQLSTILSHIESGTAGGFVFRELLRGKTNLALVPTEPAMRISVSLVWKKDSFMSDAMNNFIRHIKNLYS